MKLSIVIPVYNEEKTLNIIYKKICDVKFPVDLEMIFVDDCSRDKSADIIRSIEKNDSRVKAIFKPNNSGKGSTLKQGIEQASGDIIIVQDADLEYNPAEIPALLNLIIENKADVVYGSRFSSLSSQVGRFYHYLGNKVLTMFSNFCSNIRLTDMETCYKAFRADIIKNVIIESERFGFEPEITAKVAKLCCSIHELPIS
ncbi:MAG: glycosyltransferase, partial [uncultured bacterium]